MIWPRLLTLALLSFSLHAEAGWRAWFQVPRPLVLRSFDFDLHTVLSSRRSLILAVENSFELQRKQTPPLHRWETVQLYNQLFFELYERILSQDEVPSSQLEETHRLENLILQAGHLIPKSLMGSWTEAHASLEEWKRTGQKPARVFMRAPEPLEYFISRDGVVAQELIHAFNLALEAEEERLSPQDFLALLMMLALPSVFEDVPIQPSHSLLFTGSLKRTGQLEQYEQHTRTTAIVKLAALNSTPIWKFLLLIMVNPSSQFIEFNGVSYAKLIESLFMAGPHSPQKAKALASGHQLIREIRFSMKPLGFNHISQIQASSSTLQRLQQQYREKFATCESSLLD